MSLSIEHLEKRHLLAADLMNPTLGFGLVQEIPLSNTPDVDLADFTGDGKVDLLITVADHVDQLWIGDGNFKPGFPSLGEHDGVYSTPGDVNGDGKLDIVTTGLAGEPTVLQLNEFNSRFARSIIPGIDPALDTIEIALGDLNGDGLLDMFVANAGASPNLVLFNSGVESFFDSGQKLGNGNSKSVELADLDGDGDLDAVVANASNEGGSIGKNAVWLNDGRGVFELGSEFGPGGEHIAVGDLDSDGDLDLVGAQSEANGIWFNDGNGLFHESSQSLGSEITSHIALGDLDNDGDLDVVAANWLNASNRVWLNSGNGEFVDSEIRMDAELRSEHLALGDIDEDGDLDLVVAARRGPNRVYLNTLEPSDFDVSPNQLSEDAPVGSPVGIQAFASGNATYELHGEQHLEHPLFAIDPESGIVSLVGQLDYETAQQHVVVVTAHTQDGAFTNRFTIQVGDKIEPSATARAIDIDFESPFRQQISVNYHSDATLSQIPQGIRQATIGDDDIEVVYPDGTIAVPTFNPNSLGTWVYSLEPPGGFWDADDNGVYEIRMRHEEVSNNSGIWIPAGTITTFEVAIAEGPGPTVEVAVDDITEPLSDTHSFTVQLRSSSPMDYDADSPKAFSITRPDGSTFRPRVSAVSANDNNTRISIEFFAWTRHGGDWTADHNGVYEIHLAEAAIRDAHKLLARGGIVGSFQVDISPDTDGPSAFLSTLDVTQANSSAHVIQVTYRDNAGVELETIDAKDLSVTIPAGWSVQPQLQSIESFSNGVVATYTLEGSNGVWDASDEGVYLVQLNGDEVFDTLGNASAPTLLGRFTVAIQESDAADFNDDGNVDFADFLLLSFFFGRENAKPQQGDLTGDSVVDFADFLIFNERFAAAV